VSIVRDAWAALRAVISIADSVQELSAEVRELSKENQLIRERLVRLETIIEEARSARGRGVHAAQTPPPSLPEAQNPSP